MRESGELAERQECSTQHKEFQDRDELKEGGGVHLLYTVRRPWNSSPLLLFCEIPVLVLQWRHSHLVEVDKCMTVHRPYIEFLYTKATNPNQC